MDQWLHRSALSTFRESRYLSFQWSKISRELSLLLLLWSSPIRQSSLLMYKLHCKRWISLVIRANWLHKTLRMQCLVQNRHLTRYQFLKIWYQTSVKSIDYPRPKSLTLKMLPVFREASSIPPHSAIPLSVLIHRLMRTDSYLKSFILWRVCLARECRML